jgi:hypothetical protein
MRTRNPVQVQDYEKDEEEEKEDTREKSATKHTP